MKKIFYCFLSVTFVFLAITGCSNSSTEALASLQSENELLRQQLTAVEENNEELEQLIESLEAAAVEATAAPIEETVPPTEPDAYEAWRFAQISAKPGEMYDNMRLALNQIKEGLDTGKIGTPEYTSSVNLLVPGEISKDGYEAVEEYMDTLERYFTKNVNGVVNFVQDLIDYGFSTEESTLESFELAPNVTVEAICEELSITFDAANAIFFELEEYGFHFYWSETSE